jgi:hypothetical protein
MLRVIMSIYGKINGIGHNIRPESLKKSNALLHARSFCLGQMPVAQLATPLIPSLSYTRPLNISSSSSSSR